MINRHGEVTFERRGDHIARVTFDKPPHNNISVAMAKDIADVLELADSDPDCRVVLLASGGKTFCAGADLSNRAGEAASDKRDTNPLYDQVVRLTATKLPIVCAVQGAAVGAGLGLACVADFRVASTEARFCANFVKLGFHPGFALTHTLPAIVGLQRASLMFLTGRRIRAEDALAWGLCDAVVAPDQLTAAAEALAAEIAENAPLAVASTRATLREGLAEVARYATDHEFAEQKWLMRTDDFREGVKAVSERRVGVFKGK